MNRPTAALFSALLMAASGVSNGQSQNSSAPQDLDKLTLEELMNIKVEGAALHPQSLADAPASVTIITAEDVRKYGYRTVGEALASVRGFYTSNNDTYETIGVRGFNLPGDYASRILVMVNGHNMADNVFNFVLNLGNGFPIEMNLIRQIEIVRGPSSALYGSSGIFATINIITKSPEEAGPVSVTADTGSFGEKKAQVLATSSIGQNAKLLVSGAVFNNSGQSPLYFPQFDTPQNNNGNAVNVDGEKGYHFFSTLTWRNWTITAVASERSQVQPISWGATVFNDRGTKAEDSRSYIEAAYSRDLAGGTLRWRTYYDMARSIDRADYALDPTNPTDSGIDDNLTIQTGKWVGSQLDYRFEVAHVGTLTVGTEAKIDLEALQTDQDVAPVPFVYLHTNNPDRTIALFAQDERRLSSHWTLDLGARLDYSAYQQSFVSPRIALLYQPSSGWTYKFLYGRAFRNPSLFELFYSDGVSGVANPNARPEKADTVEFDLERKMGKRMSLVTSAYGYRLRDLLVATPEEAGLLEYLNVGKVHAFGAEIEVNGRPASWLETTASYSWQMAEDDVEKRPLENSPRNLLKLRFAIPLGRELEVSSGMQSYGSRLTLANATVGRVYLADFTLTSRRLFRNFDFQFGIRNAFNRDYSDPIALNPLVDTMQQRGRTFFVELIAHTNRREPPPERRTF